MEETSRRSIIRSEQICLGFILKTHKDSASLANPLYCKSVLSKQTEKKGRNHEKVFPYVKSELLLFQLMFFVSCPHIMPCHEKPGSIFYLFHRVARNPSMDNYKDLFLPKCSSSALFFGSSPIMGMDTLL